MVARTRYTFKNVQKAAKERKKERARERKERVAKPRKWEEEEEEEEVQSSQARRRRRRGGVEKIIWKTADTRYTGICREPRALCHALLVWGDGNGVARNRASAKGTP